MLFDRLARPAQSRGKPNTEVPLYEWTCSIGRLSTYTVITIYLHLVEFNLLVVQVQMSSLSCCEGRSQQVYRWDGTALYCQHTSCCHQTVVTWAKIMCKWSEDLLVNTIICFWSFCSRGLCETASNALFTVVKEYSTDVVSLFHKLT